MLKAITTKVTNLTNKLNNVSLEERSKAAVSVFTGTINELKAINAEASTRREGNKKAISALMKRKKKIEGDNDALD